MAAPESKGDSRISNNGLKQQWKSEEECNLADKKTHHLTDVGDSNKSFLDSSVYSEGNVHHQKKPFMSVLDDLASPYNLKNIPPIKRPHSAREISSRTPPMRLKLFASTPASLQLHSGGGAEYAVDAVTPMLDIPEGTFLGDAMHRDGSLFSIVFQVRMYVTICRDKYTTMCTCS